MVRTTLFIVFMMMTRIAYAQYLDFMEPQKLPPSVNSEDEEILPMLSADGKTLFFSRILHAGNVGGKYSGSDVWTSSKVNGTWTKARNTDYPFNTKNNDGVIGLSADGKTAYLLQTSGSKKLRGIYFTKKLNTTWSEPELIPIDGLDNTGFAGFYVSPDFDVIIISMNAPDTKGEEDLYITTKNAKGNWSKIKNLGPAINSAGFEIAPFLSADKQRLYFSSSGHDGYGDSDIYFSDRLYSSYETWSTPRNLGQTINTPGFDGYFSIYGDSLAFFSSNRNGGRTELFSTNVTVLAGPFIDRKKMLNRSEQEQLIGKNISTRFEFQNEDVELGFAQQERMFYLCNKILTMRNISLQLVVVEENNKPLTQKRIDATIEYIKSTGIEAARVVPIESKRNIKPSSKTVIEVLLYHDEL